MTLVITNFENELIWHSAGVTYQALGQMHGDFKTFETVSTHNKHRIWPRKQSKRAVSEKVFQLFKGEKDGGGQREGLRLLDLQGRVGVKQLVIGGRTSSSSRNFLVKVLIWRR